MATFVPAGRYRLCVDTTQTRLEARRSVLRPGPGRILHYSRLAFAVAVALFATGLIGQCALGELPLIRLDTIFPPGGQIGGKVEVIVSGGDLDQLRRLSFSHPGISAERKIAESGSGVVERTFVVTIGDETPPGVYEARVTGRFGISNPRAFAVGALKEEVEEGGNKGFDAANDIPLDTEINGRADANFPDYFKFTAKLGSRLLIQCMTERIDSRMNPVLLLHDSERRELNRSRQGDLLDFTVPKNGEYFLKLHDFVHGGGDGHVYRLRVSTGPHIDFVFPPAGRPGSKGSYVLHGRNLPNSSPSSYSVNGKALEQLSVEIELPENDGDQRPAPAAPVDPPASGLDGFVYRLIMRTDGGERRVSNPVFLGFASEPIVLEEEPNNTGDAANSISIPSEFVGQFYPPGDRDWISFEAVKGDVFWVEIISQRLGLPTNPFVVVHRVHKNDNGEEKISDVKELYDSDRNIGGREFDTRSRDPVWRFPVKDSGSYRIQIRDLFYHSKSDARLVYRVSIRKETPDFELVAMSVAPDVPGKNEAMQWTPFLRKGDSVPVRVFAMRHHNFDGEITVCAEGLPEGVVCDPEVISKGESSVSIVLTAVDDASGWIGPLRVVGRGRIGEEEVTREAKGASVVWSVADYNNESVTSRMTGDFAIGVSEDEVAPLSLRSSSEDVWESWVGGTLEIPIDVIRRGELKGDVKVDALGKSPLNKVKEIQVKSDSENSTLKLDFASLKISAGEHSFYLRGQTKGKYRRASTEQMKALEAEVKSAEAAVMVAEKESSELAERVKNAREDSTGSAISKRLEATNRQKEQVVAVLTEAKEALKRVEPVDTSMTAFSPPIRLRIAESPIDISVDIPDIGVHQGGKSEIVVNLRRLFDFDGSVDLRVTAAENGQGVGGADATIPKGETNAKILLAAAPTATPGKHNLTLQAVIKIKGKEIKKDLILNVTVLAGGKGTV